MAPKKILGIRRSRFLRGVRAVHDFLSLPLALVLLTYSKRVDPAYNMPWYKRAALGFRFYRNEYRMTSGTSWRAHLVMAMKLLEIPQHEQGDIVECGCWKGGATVNLSIIAAIVGRKFRIYDSFEGLPPPTKGDPVAERSFKDGFVAGVYGGTLQEVKANVEKYGAIGPCSFHKGWFKDTLPDHDTPVVLAFWDVDYYASLHDCIVNLWPHLVDGGYVFLDEYRNVAYCSVFFSERYWKTYLDCAPPGIVGTGTGVQVGMCYSDPGIGAGRPGIQHGASTAYSRKGEEAFWDYFPAEDDAAHRQDPAAVEESEGGRAQPQV